MLRTTIILHVPSGIVLLLLAGCVQYDGLTGSSSGVARGDFNGDGFGDLAIGIPGKDVFAASPDSGAVLVIYGSGSGLAAPSTLTPNGPPLSQLWTQNTSGMPARLQGSESGDNFGAALASGDFNGDGLSDLAIGAPNERYAAVANDGQNATFQGMVTILFGSNVGLRPNGSKAYGFADSFGQANFTIPPNRLVLSRYGQALAWGDFDDDGFGDLAVGAPGTSIDPNSYQSFDQPVSCGAVHILRGSPDGLTEVEDGSPDWIAPPGGLHSSEPDTRVFEERPESGANFGRALSAGDYDGDGKSDLAIGAPFKTVIRGFTQEGVALFTEYAGVVSVYTKVATSNGRFRAAKLFGHSAARNGFDGIGGTPRSFERFGASLASGDFDGDGRSDLAIGIPEASDGDVTQAGAVSVLYSRRTCTTCDQFQLGLAAKQFWTQARLFNNTQQSEVGDAWGSALAAGDFDGDGFWDLAVGAPFEDMETSVTIRNAGRVDIIYGSAQRLTNTTRTPRAWLQGSASALQGAPRADNRFGSSLAAWNFGRDDVEIVPGFPPNPPSVRITRTADLAIGVPNEFVSSRSGAGAIHVIYGTKESGLTSNGNQIWSLSSSNVPGTAASGDAFGSALY